MIIPGQNIMELRTMKWEYDNNCINAIDAKGQCYRINVIEFIKLINGVNFKTIKKKVHTYLEVEHYDGIDKVR